MIGEALQAAQRPELTDLCRRWTRVLRSAPLRHRFGQAFVNFVPRREVCAEIPGRTGEQWLPACTATVALVGIHVVGSTAGHPEMIWATFEHLGNTPNDAYSYRNSGGGTTPTALDTSGTWLFTTTGSTGPFNLRHAIVSGANIAAESPPTPIGPDNIIRHKAWGAASDVQPNPLKTTPASNSEIISVNNSVRGVLIAGDVRRNYIMTGSTWLIAGSFPFASFNTTQVGTSKLSNTTMETFTQGASPTAASTLNCFSCHPAGKTTNVSHVFSSLKPLF